jgi:hypothetical protein
MGLLVIYAVLMTVWALGMTIEYTKVTGYRRGYDKGYTDAKKNCYQDCGFDEVYKCDCSSEDCPDSYKS